MGKYYVRTGSLHEVIAASDARDAACKTLRRELRRWYGDLRLGATIGISERGFEDLANHGHEVPLGDFLDEAGLRREMSGFLREKLGCSTEHGGSRRPAAAKIFPLDCSRIEHDGRRLKLMTWGASGRGRTVHVWQIEGQPLCIDIYGFETETYSAAISHKPEIEIELCHPMPDESVLRALTLSSPVN